MMPVLNQSSVTRTVNRTMAAQETDSHEGHAECAGGLNLHWCEVPYVGHPIRISSFMNPLAGIPNAPTLPSGLFENDFIQLLAKVLRFTYDAPHHPPDGVIGMGSLHNGIWTGCIGEIQRDEVDVCVSFSESVNTFEKSDYCDSSYPVTYDVWGMIMPAPVEGGKSLSLLLPFSLGVWTLFLFTALVVMVFFWISGTFFTGENNKFQPFSRWFLFVIGSFSAVGERGYFFHRQTVAYKVLVVFWCLPVLVILNVYRAYFHSIVTMPSEYYLTGGISNLPDRPDITVYFFKGSTIDAYLSNQIDGPFNNVATQLSSHPKQKLKQSDVEQIFRLVNDKNVFIGSYDAVLLSVMEMDLQRNRNHRRFSLSREGFNSMGRVMHFQKNSELREIFYYGILVLQQHGFIEHLNRKYYGQSNNGFNKKTAENRKLTLKDLSGIFMLFGICMGFSTFVLLCEIIVARFIKRHSQIVRREPSAEFKYIGKNNSDSSTSR